MAKTSRLHFYPERIAWIGAMVIGFGCLLTLPFVFMLYQTGSAWVSLSGKKESGRVPTPLSFSLQLNEADPLLPIPELQGEMTLSFDPPRPIGGVRENLLLVRLKKSGLSKRVALPCRLDLEFLGDQLRFAQENSPFWLELSLTDGGQIEGTGFIAAADGGRMHAGRFVVPGQDSPLQGAQEFAEESPFRLLAEARWWGRDQLREKKDCGERLEISAAEWVELKEGDWLVWKDQKWQKSGAPEKDLPIAHLQSVSSKELIVEGWDSSGHVRLSLTPPIASPFKMKGEEVFSSIRVRSEKQISCMMEKQCVVLKIGDWVLKTGGRWKILRKKEERDAFLNGKLFGEMFIFEQIVQKQGQKMIMGRLFNPGRTQMIAIEMGAQSSRKAKSRAQ